MAYRTYRYRSIFLVLLPVVVALTSWVSTSEAVCTPLGTSTPNFGLCKPGNGETGWTNAINGNWDILDNRGGVPSGAIMFYAGPTPPANWYACDGSAKSRTIDAALFAVIGTTFGPGDGSTTFNVPDGRSRNVVMAGTGTGLSARNLAATGGEESHPLTVAEMPAHTHTSIMTNGTGGSIRSLLGTATSLTTTPTQMSLANSTGGNGTHNVMDPFLVLTCMIKR